MPRIQSTWSDGDRPARRFVFVTLVALTLGSLVSWSKPDVRDHRISNTFFAASGFVAMAPPHAPVWAAYPMVQLYRLPHLRSQQWELVEVTSPQFAKVEHHETIIGDYGTARMRKISNASFSATEPLACAPNAQHLMLMNPIDEAALRMANAKVDVELHFTNGESLTFTLPVKPLLESP